MTSPSFEQAVGSLYAGSPDEFVASRTALVKQARAEGDKELAQRIGALRKPGAAAYVINRMAREGMLAPLAKLGEELREAQSQLDTRAMHRLSDRRRELFADLLERARKRDSLSPSVAEQIHQTFTAAVASQTAQEAVMSGALVKPLSYSGFGDVDITDALATEIPRLQLVLGDGDQDPGRSKGGAQPDDPTPAHEAAPEQRLKVSERALAAALRARDKARLEATTAEVVAMAAQDRVRTAEQAVATARRTLKATEKSLADALAAREAADEKAARLADELVDAEAVYDALTQGEK